MLLPAAGVLRGWMGALRTPVPRTASRPDVEIDEGALELSEVPATVVCATCGLPECNCDIDRPSSFSGVVAIVPWERPGGSLLSRLWSTAKLCTLSPDSFFAALPPGGVLAPLLFGLVSELLAATGLCATLGAVVLTFVPGLVAELSVNLPLRGTILQAAGVGVPGRRARAPSPAARCPDIDCRGCRASVCRSRCWPLSVDNPNSYRFG